MNDWMNQSKATASHAFDWSSAQGTGRLWGADLSGSPLFNAIGVASVLAWQQESHLVRFGARVETDCAALEVRLRRVSVRVMFMLLLLICIRIVVVTVNNVLPVLGSDNRSHSTEKKIF